MSDEMEKQLALLKEKYLASLPNKIRDIRTLWEVLVEKKNLAGLEELHRMAHSLSGSGATFGAAHVSILAKELENHVKEFVSDVRIFEPENISQIDVLLNNLEGILSEG